MLVEDLGTLEYRAAWAMQEDAHAEVLGGGPERIFLIEHPPVITLGRRTGLQSHLLKSELVLQQMGVEVVQSDRGGEVTFHGPGQIVCYPIIRLVDHGLSVSGYVHALQDAVIDTLATLGVTAQTDRSIGVWVKDANQPAKICAFGVRIRRGVSMHGLALNVATDLNYFNLIVPCGTPGAAVTSLERLLGRSAPDIQTVKQILVESLRRRFSLPKASICSA